MFDIEYPPNNYTSPEHYSITTLEKIRNGFFKDRNEAIKLELWLRTFVETIKTRETPFVAESYANDAVKALENYYNADK